MPDEVLESVTSQARSAGGRAAPIDGVLVVSFGGPRGPADVLPFLENVTAGRGIPRERLEVVAEHYFSRGGVSPINAETDAFIEAMRVQLAARGRGDVAVYSGNRNWSPTIAEALTTAAGDGRAHLAVVLTSAYSGYSSCRQYRENIADAAAQVEQPLRDRGLVLPRLSFVRPWGLQAEVVEAWGRLATGAVKALPADDVRLVFVAHSIPSSAARASGPPGEGGAYVRELTDLAGRVAEHVRGRVGSPVRWSIAYCSRSGLPQTPWLEPDISDELADLAAQGVRGVAAVPIGFVADHMEVVQDLDTVAAADASRLGIAWHRAPTLRDDPHVAGRLAELALAAGEQPGQCPRGCCAPVGRPGAPVADRAAAFEGR